MTAPTLFTDPRTAPGPIAPRCSAAGCRAYAHWAVFGVWFCTAHRPSDFLDCAREHSRAVRGRS